MMRERITFVHPQGADVDPKSLKISNTELHGPLLESVREDRLSISLGELPADLAKLLPRFRDFCLRWVSPFAHDTLEPYVSRISPGLHISYTLANDKDVEAEQKACVALLGVGTKDCSSNEAFTTKGEGRSVDSPTATLYEQLERVSTLTAWAAKELCVNNDSDCQTRLKGLSSSASLDVSWDGSAQIMRIAAVSALHRQDVQASSIVGRRTEVGILSKDTPPNQQAHEVGVSGLLAVLGENKEPSGTMFSFPSRHRASETSFSSKFVEPTGLHPTLLLMMSSNKAPVADEHCALYAYVTLPKTVFADRYQFADRLFLASKNLTALRYTSLPVDLEAPAYTTKTWGSSILLELSAPSSEESLAWTAEVPLHLRYLKPSRTGTVDIEIPYPAVFWACDSTAGADYANNPFDRLNIGYDRLFSRATVFWHVKPEAVSGNRLMSLISVPALKDQATSWIVFGTAAAILVGFGWILWKLVAVLTSSGYGRGRTKAVEEMERKKRR